jgi:hypothetical protein
VKRLESFEVLYTIGLPNEGVALNLGFPLPSQTLDPNPRLWEPDPSFHMKSHTGFFLGSFKPIFNPIFTQNETKSVFNVRTKLRIGLKTESLSENRPTLISTTY